MTYQPRQNTAKKTWNPLKLVLNSSDQEQLYGEKKKDKMSYNYRQNTTKKSRNPLKRVIRKDKKFLLN
jgi:hypothetical protein